jgi:hypothetical protein
VLTLPSILNNVDAMLALNGLDVGKALILELAYDILLGYNT